MKKRFFTLFFSFLPLCISLPAMAALKDQDTVKRLESQSTLPQIKRAAAEGDPDAQYALGYLYYYGREVPQDMGLAKKWIKKAADQGQQQAVQAEKILMGTMPSIQPKVNPILQPDGESPEKPHTPVVPRDDMKKEPVVPNNQQSISELIKEQTPVLQQKEDQPVTQESTPVLKASGIETPQTPTKPIIKNTETTSPTPPPAKPEPKAPKPKAPVQILNTPKENYFTVQLLSSSKKQDILRFMEKYHFKEASYYETYRDGQKWYVVTYGKYPSRKAASSAIHKLPEGVKKNTPWVKSSEMVNKEMVKKK